MDRINSPQNKRARYIKALQTKARLRRGEGQLVLEGDRLIGDALASGGKPSLALYAPESADYALIAKLQNRKCELLPASNEILRYLSDTRQPSGLLAVFALPKPAIPRAPERIVILDAVGEPGNLGTILRTAAASGVKLAILGPGCVDPYNPKVMRAAMGAHFRLPVVEAGWSEIAGFCQDLPMYAASAESPVSYADVEWHGAWGLIVGNEARGISREARRLAKAVVSIPMSGEVESINVASAAAVILFEAQRQRLATDSD